mgnify:CR=1 FL=1
MAHHTEFGSNSVPRRAAAVPLTLRVVVAFAAVLQTACGPSDEADASSAPPQCAASHLGGAVNAAKAGDVCTSVLHLAEGGPRYSVSCGPATTVTQASAEALFTEPNYGPPYWGLAQDALPEAYVFFHDPADFGGVGVVSAQSGMLVARVKTMWLSSTSVADPPPNNWSTPAACRSSAALPTAKGLRLRGGQIPIVDPLEPGAVDEALKQLSNTPLADELAQRASVNVVLILDNEAAGRMVVIESTPLDP